MSALELDTGELVWSRRLLADHPGKLADYGMASSPLLVDDLVVVLRAMNARPSLVAYRRSDGAPAWSAGEGLAGYGSPVLATVGGVRQVLVTNQRSVAGHDPASGASLWRIPWPVPGEKVTPPLPLGEDRLLVSAVYGAGSRLLELSSAWSATCSSCRRSGATWCWSRRPRRSIASSAASRRSAARPGTRRRSPGATSWFATTACYELPVG